MPSSKSISPPLIKTSSIIKKRVGSGLKNKNDSTLSLGVSFDAPSPTDSNSSIMSNALKGGDEEGIGGEENNDNDDPLLSLFRVHNTNRVKFDLTSTASSSNEGENEDDNNNNNGNKSSSSPTNISSNSSILISPNRQKASTKFKNFFKRTPSNLTASCLLSNNNNNNNNNKDSTTFDALNSSSEVCDPEDALIKKMLEPTPMRRISSFLDNIRSSSSSGRLDEKAITLGELNALPQSSATTSASTTIEGNTNNTTHRTNNISKSSKEHIAKLLKKAQRAHKKSFRYKLAMKYYLQALKEMTEVGYSDTDPLTIKVLKSLNNVHHAQSTIQNSANIVSMGIQHEDNNQLIKALRMYTIAYRMRRDSLGVDHPSLAVLLNMMGSVQVKRGEYSEAMKIYELSLKGRPDENGGVGRNKNEFRNMNPLTTSVTLRDMGMILEHKGNEDKALKFYHASLRYAVKFKTVTNENEQQQQKSLCKSNITSGIGGGDGSDTGSAQAPSDYSDSSKGGIAKTPTSKADWLDNMDSNFIDDSFSLKEVRMAKTTTMGKAGGGVSKASATSQRWDHDVAENGEMELFLEKRFDRWALSDSNDIAKGSSGDSTKFYYDELFLPGDQQQQQQQSNNNNKQDKAKDETTPADMDIAMTLHQIGQIHRRSHRYAAALSAYNASLRGMKEVLGSRHGNIAAILGNIGNLYMETGDYDEAFTIYQEVLGIETLHLGLSHPEVAVTLHNIATIECSRGNFSEGVSLYRQVVDMQKIRYGNEHLTVAITLSCLADALEKIRNVNGAIQVYEEALKIRSAVLGKSHLDCGRIMHKLGRLASTKKDFAIADIYMMRALEIYEANMLNPHHIFMLEMARDNADIQAGLAFAKK